MVILNNPIHTIDAEVRSDYYDLFRPAFEGAGFTTIARSRPLEMHMQCDTRLRLLNACFLKLLETAPHYDTVTYDKLSGGLLAQIELVQDVQAQLDIYNTIDTLPHGCLDFGLKYRDKNGKPRSPSAVLRSYMSGTPAKDLRAEYDLHTPASPLDEARALLIKAQAGSRRSYMLQRIHNQLQLAHRDGWFIIFDTLTLDPDRLRAFYDTPTALRDYFRSVGHRVLKAEGRSTKESHSDCYQYLCVPEYGGKTGRLHFHAIHLMRTLPRNTRDPNFGRPSHSRTYRQIGSMLGMWKYGFTQPIGVRYAADAFSRLGWLWPVDKKTGEAVQSKPLIAIAHYVGKYISKQTEQSLARKNLGDSEWTKQLRQDLATVPTAAFRVRMSRGFGMKVPSMEHLSTECLIQMTRLSSSVTKLPAVLKQNARRMLRSRLARLSVSDCLELKPKTQNLLKLLRDSIAMTQGFSLPNFISTMTPTITSTDISNETLAYLLSDRSRLYREPDGRTQASFGIK